MNCKNFFVVFFLLVSACTAYNIETNETEFIHKKNFTNKGFTLVYSEDLYKNKIISKKIDHRALIIFQKNLKKGTSVKIKNILNNKTVIAKVGANSKYPLFNNSVISNRIAMEIELDHSEPYIEVIEILRNSAFIAKKVKIFDEEKKVADKAPIDTISVNNLNEDVHKTKKIEKDKFNYIIKIADFYFKDSAHNMIDRIKKETPVKNIRMLNLSKTQYRVFLGPFDNINSLQKAFNNVNILEFESIEIIKNVKNI